MLNSLANQLLKLLISTLTGLFLLAAQSATARDIYVSIVNSTGVEDGTLANPYNSIQEAANVAVSGDIVFIRAGNYREEVKMPANGVTYQPYQNELVTINGTDQLTGWTAVSGSQIFQTTMNWNAPEANQLFVDSKMIYQARWPNQTSADLISPTDAVAESATASGNNFTLKCNAFNEPDGRWVGADIWVNLSRPAGSGTDGQGWTGKVVSTNLAAKTITVNFGEAPRLGEQPWSVGVGTEFYMFNPTKAGVDATGGVTALLDFGEWWKDGSILYVKTPNGLAPTESATGSNIVEAKRRDLAFTSGNPIGSPNTNRNSYTIRKLNLFACTISTDVLYKTRQNTIVEDAYNITIDGITAKYISHFTDQTGDWQAQYYGNTGIVISGRDNVLKNSTLQISAGPAVCLVGYGNKLLNNSIDDANYSCTNAGAVNTAKICVDGEIAYNRINNTTIMGINFNFFKNSDARYKGVARIHHNVVTNFMKRSDDSGGLDVADVLTQAGNWVRIDHNVCYNTRAREVSGNSSVFGIYFDFSAGGYLIDHNVVYNCQRPMIINSSPKLNIFNNTLLNGNPSDVSVLNGNGGTGLSDTIRNNILSNTANTTCCSWGNLSQAVFTNNATFVTGTTAANTFVDIPNRNYQLKSTATNAIDLGIDYGQFNDPVIGAAVDYGAYEYGTLAWQAGITSLLPPKIYPNGGSYYDSIIITLSSDTSGLGVDIRYTIDGSEPNSASLLYTGPFKISSSTIIKSGIFLNSGARSDISSAIFTISASPVGGLRNPDNPSPVAQGIISNYYETTQNYQQLPNFSLLTPARIDTASLIEFQQPYRVDNFAFLFKGYIEVPTDGVYTFYTNSDDGSKLFIGDSLIVNNDGSHPAQERNGIIGLKAGKHAITVQYFEGGGSESLQVYYKGPGIAKQIIPANILWYLSAPIGPDVSFSPTPGSYPLSVNVTMLTSAPGAVIHYTTDGSSVSTASPAYINPINVTSTTAFKAKAFLSTLGGLEKNATYTITGPIVSISPNGGSFTDSIAVTLTGNPVGSVIFYTTDGSAPTAASIRYLQPFKLYTTTTIKAIAISNTIVGDVVTAIFNFTGPSVTITPNGGSFNDSTSVALTSPSSGVSIYYTTDGSSPSASSLQYTVPFKLYNSATVKAIAIKNGSVGEMATAVFTILGPEVTIAPSGGVFQDITSVTLSSTATGASIFYTLDGVEPTVLSTVYSAPFTLSTSTTVKAIAFKNGIAGSVKNALFTINQPSVSIAPLSGTFFDSVLVTLSAIPSSSKIYYTTNGTTPTTSSTLYSQPFKLGSSATIKALAVTTGGLSSAVASSVFEINRLSDGALIFPNPSPKGKFSVRLNKPGNGQVIQMIIYDGAGKSVYRSNITATSGGAPQVQAYNLPFLKPSTYLVTLQTISYHAEKFYAQIPMIVK